MQLLNSFWRALTWPGIVWIAGRLVDDKGGVDIYDDDDEDYGNHVDVDDDNDDDDDKHLAR